MSLHEMIKQIIKNEKNKPIKISNIYYLSPSFLEWLEERKASGDYLK